MAVKAGTKRKSLPKSEEAGKRVRIDEVQPSTSKNPSPSGPNPTSVPKKSSLKKTAETAQLEPEETEELLKGFETSSDENSSDEDDDDENSSVDEDADAQGASSSKISARDLPSVAKDEKVANKLSSAKKSKSKAGVVFIGRLPRGFEEDQLKQYFEQFGTVNRLRLSRNKKTGSSKHYAFLEFAHEAVAEIVAETMNNYLLLGHILVCHVIPEQNVHPRLWAGANKKFRVMPRGRKQMHQHNAPKTEEQQSQIKRRLKKKEAEKRKKLQAAGIEYDFEGYQDSAPPKAVEGEAAKTKA